MIGKHMKGQEFSRCLNYVLDKPGAELIGGNVAGQAAVDYNKEFQQVAAKSERTTRPLLHCALSLAPGETLSDHHWRMLSLEYLSALGFQRNQFLLVRHTDTPTHEHVHLMVNRVSLNGKTVSDSWDYMHSQASIHKLETKYGLVHAPLSWEKHQQGALKQHLFSELPLAHLPASVRRAMELQRRVRAALNTMLVTETSINSLTHKLAGQNIQVHFLKRQSRSAGISFELEGERFSGSRLGKSYSLPKLLEMMAVNKQTIQVEESVAQLEPEAALPIFHQRYLELVKLVRQRLGKKVSSRDLDLAISAIALHSKSPEEGRSLIYSPDVQTLQQHQGNEAAQHYLQELMREAQQKSKASWDDILPNHSDNFFERQAHI